MLFALPFTSTQKLKSDPLACVQDGAANITRPPLKEALTEYVGISKDTQIPDICHWS